MLIGTPLAANATRVMLLGAGELGKEVIIALQRLGVETIAVDRYPNAPGQQVAHRAHVIDMTDGAALRALVERERPAIIVPEIEAIATATLVQIQAEGLAEVIPTARAAQLTMNREGIRRLAAEELGLPTSRYAFVDSLAQLRAAADEIGFPCFLKPVMSSSGKGQSRVQDAAELERAWHYALDAGRVRQARLIVEAQILFDYEITLLTVRSLGVYGNIETHYCAPIGHRQVHGDYVESWQPQVMSDSAFVRARDNAGRITAALGGRGRRRPHDTGLVTLASQRLSEFELHARAILGLPVDVDLSSPAASAVIYGQLEATGIGYTGVDEALRIPGTDIRLFGKPESHARRRMGVALARAADVELARQRARDAAARVRPVMP